MSDSNGEDLMFHMADVACVRAWEDEGWGPFHKRLLTMCVAREHNGWKKANGMTKIQKLVKHLKKTGSISHREAMDDYQMSGGALTKYISQLRNEYHMNIVSLRRTHPITGQVYTRYTLNG
jgi:hypothetical protein